jgi:dihydrofolate synthase/folylpolyglutamate synthase
MTDLRAEQSAECEAFLYSRINYERRSDDSPATWTFKLETIAELLRRRGNPQERYPIVHVAGTKGKGSVATMLAGILSAAGYRTGTYSSPHLENVRERIVLDGQPISSSELSAVIDRFRPDIADIDRQAVARPEWHAPTFFEIMTAAAFDYFAEREVDAAMIEVGMGGRLDSTNICQPRLAVITNIGIDHQRQLGGTRSLIAAEKAGIIKPGVPLICGVRPGKAADVIAEVARRNDAPTFWLGRDFHCAVAAKKSPRVNRFSTWGTVGRAYRLVDCRTALSGRHQSQNGAIAIAAAQWLAAAGWAIPAAALRQGLASATIPGRFQVVDAIPRVVLDIAHNEMSIRAALHTWLERFGEIRSGRTLVFSASRDKRISRMLTLLLPYFDSVILTQIVGSPRGCDVQTLRTLCDKALGHWSAESRPNPRIAAAENSSVAWELARRHSGSEGAVFVTGSAFLVGEMLPVIRLALDAPATFIDQITAVD